MRRTLALLAFLAAVFGAVGGQTGRAGAASPSRQGWWKVGLPIADAGIGGVGDLRDPQGIDVPDGGLLVQGGASVDQPAAYAALAFDLGTAQVSGPLRLAPAPSAVSVPGSRLIACPLDGASFTSSDGGALVDGPKYSCASAVNATVEGSGVYVFDVAGLRRGEALALAIVPSAPTDRVVFARPGDDALRVTESTGDAGGGETPVLPPPETIDSTAGVAAPPPDIGTVPYLGSSPVVAAPTETEPVAPAAPLLPQARAVTAARPSDDASATPYIVLALVGLAGVLWIGAGSGGAPAEESR
jgi:hypothetical protein